MNRKSVGQNTWRKIQWWFFKTIDIAVSSILNQLSFILEVVPYHERIILLSRSLLGLLNMIEWGLTAVIVAILNYGCDFLKVGILSLIQRVLSWLRI